MSRLGPELGSWRQPCCDFQNFSMIFSLLCPSLTVHACIKLRNVVFVLSPGCPLLRFAHPQGRGQSGAWVILPARPLQPPLGGLPERWAASLLHLLSSALQSHPFLAWFCLEHLQMAQLQLHNKCWLDTFPQRCCRGDIDKFSASLSFLITALSAYQRYYSLQSDYWKVRHTHTHTRAYMLSLSFT